MPRRSAASLSVTTTHALPTSIPPPDHLSDAQARRWTDIVSTKPLDWLTDDTVGLLTELVRAESESDRVANQLMEITSAEMETRDGMARYTALCKVADLWAKQQANLARALRLTPHSKITARQAGAEAPRGPKPWEFLAPRTEGDS